MPPSFEEIPLKVTLLPSEAPSFVTNIGFNFKPYSLRGKVVNSEVLL